ncbi:MAG: PqqD family protein [Persephonella sp.]|nr:MAG: PqqD family protein [Persephonella sp.]RUM60080.1 MAG: PqqD family protein [Persephonella sp.]
MGRLNQLAINDEGFIFDPLTGESFTVNRTGLFIIKKLKENKSEEEILEDMLNEFNVSKDIAEKDLIDFIQKLKSYGLV